MTALSGVISPELRAEDQITFRRDSVNLTDRKTSDQLVMDLELANPSSFDITIQAATAGNNPDKRYFYLTPQGEPANKGGSVKVHIDLPYDQLTPGGPYQPETINTVEVNQTRTASNAYSQCHESGRARSGGRVCKPLSFLVIDDGAIPGVLYQARLNVMVRGASSKPVTKSIILTYRNDRSAIGIYSANDRFILNSNNNFRTQNDFCVYSYGESRSFDVRLEGQKKQRQLELQDRNGNTLPYHAQFRSLEQKSYQDLPANRWRPAGMSKRLTDRSIGCGAGRNLSIALTIPRSEVLKSPAGSYKDTLTVRVRAK